MVLQSRSRAPKSFFTNICLRINLQQINIFMVLSGLPFSILAQGDNEIYSQPTLGISHKGNGIYTINNSMEIRNFAYRKKQWEARTRHIDLIHFSNFKYLGIF